MTKEEKRQKEKGTIIARYIIRKIIGIREYSFVHSIVEAAQALYKKGLLIIYELKLPVRVIRGSKHNSLETQKAGT